jgi:hypothetical protein
LFLYWITLTAFEQRTQTWLKSSVEESAVYEILEDGKVIE